MAKSTNKPPVTPGQPAGRQKPRQTPTVAAGSQESGKAGLTGTKLHMVVAGCIALITWLFFRVCLDNQLTNWDDPGYIRDNALIKSTTPEALKLIFSTPIMGNYHPLTILSYAIEYSYVRLEPWLFHLDSVLLHIVVTTLVYVFVLMLTKRTVAAAVTAILFGLHPMHVESVAWLAGRKDVLYGTFYMASCILYIRYIRAENGRWKWYAGVVLLFLASLLSKPVAVTLPVVLLLIDYFEQRKISWALLVEKLPLFAISVAFGIRSMIDQRSFGSLSSENIGFNFAERIALGGYAFVTYLWKAIVPVGLSCFYPYPARVGGSLPLYYFVYPIIAIAVLAAIWFFRRNRVVVFSSLFFLANIALLLQFLPVGGAIVADRYSYIPYMGLFLMLGWFLSGFFEAGGARQTGNIALGALGAYCLYLGMLTTDRCKAWYDTTSLWRDEIEKHPDAPNAFNNLGFHYFNKFNESVNDAERRIFFDSSYNLLSRSIQLDANFTNPHVSIGELHRAAGNYALAKPYYYHALTMKDKDGAANAYLGLAIIYAITQNIDSSGFCFRKALENKPYFPEVHSNYGNYFDMLKQPDSALKHYGMAIAQNPDMYAPYLNRGRLFQRMKRCDEAIRDFEAASSLNPDMGEIYYSRSYCHTQNGNKAQALRDVEKAIQLGFKQIDPAYYQMLKGG
jgi:tetratricopeptide (TPR) repeat protein